METEKDEDKRRRLGEKIELWKIALTQVSDLKGMDAKGRLETELIEDIVSDIYNRLGVPLWTTTLPQLIGMKDHIKRITSWLKDGSEHTIGGIEEVQNKRTADILTIWGMGGIGKTSLANYVYELHRHEYTRSSFVGDISRRWAGNHGLLDLKKQLCCDISKGNLTRVHNVTEYTLMIWKALESKKVLLVLDDVDSVDQLEELLGDKGFYPGSKIILTTKFASLTESCILFNPLVQPKHIKVLVDGLHEAESLELLCIHAFKSRTPKNGYQEVSEKLVKYCEGHPLALEVLGKALRHCKDVDEWEYYIEGLKKEPHSRINKALKMSFDSLPLRNEKELFKHIACFFIGMDKDLIEVILNACDINTKFGIQTLIDRCLIRIESNKLMMHQLVQEMGRVLVHQESPNRPWERSRLCCHEESLKVLEQEKGSENLIGLSLDMSLLKKDKSRGLMQLTTEALNKMGNLSLLQLNYVKINGCYERISKELRWLCMHGFLCKSIPLELPMENLVVLDMSYSNIEFFDMCCGNPQPPAKRQKGLIGSSSKKKRLLGSLKILDLSFCDKLQSVSGFSELPILEKLVISNCTSLIHVSKSIKHCIQLVFIDLSYCKKIEKLPRTIHKLKKLKTLLSNGCDHLVFPPELRDMHSLQTIEADNIGKNSQTSYFDGSRVIQRGLTSFMSYLPISLVCLSLKNNNLSNKAFSIDFSRLSVLKELYLDGNPIDSMPSCLRSLSRLELLSMKDCLMLKIVAHPPPTLRTLRISTTYPGRDRNFISQIFFDSRISQLNLELYPWVLRTSSYEIEGVVKIQCISDFEERVLSSLGWTNLWSIKNQQVGTLDIWGNTIESEVQINLSKLVDIYIYIWRGLLENEELTKPKQGNKEERLKTRTTEVTKN